MLCIKRTTLSRARGVVGLLLLEEDEWDRISEKGDKQEIKEAHGNEFTHFNDFVCFEQKQQPSIKLTLLLNGQWLLLFVLLRIFSSP